MKNQCFIILAGLMASLALATFVPVSAQTVDDSPVRVDATQPVPGRLFTAQVDSPVDAGALYTLAFDPFTPSVPYNLPGVGELGLALSPSFLLLQTTFLDSKGHGSFSLTMPPASGLVGLRFHLQALVYTRQRPSGAILSNLYAGAFSGADSHTAVPGNAKIPRALHTATVLQDGRVLIVGGGNGTLTTPVGTTVSEVYYPWTKRFDYTRNRQGAITALTTLRVMHTATRLDDGRVLIAGGVDSQGNVVAAAEVFDPKSGVFTAVGSMTKARAAHTATKLPNGLVLVAGGTVSSFAYPAVFGGATRTTEIYSPVTNTFTAGPTMIGKRLLHAALPLKSGGKDYVLLMSGFNGLFFGLLPTYTAKAEVYDVGAKAFVSKIGTVSIGSLKTARAGFGAAVQGNGRVLVVGGVTGTVPAAMKSIEEFNPVTGTFATMASMTVERAVPVVTPLAGGKILIQGGVQGTLLAPTATDTCYLYAGGKLSAAAALKSTRAAHAGVLLGSGVVLAVGGGDKTSKTLDTAEYYTP